MGIGSALKKINARVKVLQKKHPKTKRVTLQKQAGKEYKAGKLKVKRKVKRRVAKRVVKRRAVKRVRKRTARKRVNRAVMRVSKPVSRRVYRPKVVRVKSYKAARYRRVSGTGKSLMPIVLLAGAGLIAYMLLKPKPVTSYPQYQPTGNPTRDAAASNILAWATAAGLAISSITKLLDAINKGSDSDVQAINNSVNSAGALPPWIGI